MFGFNLSGILVQYCLIQFVVVFVVKDGSLWRPSVFVDIFRFARLVNNYNNFTAFFYRSGFRITNNFDVVIIYIRRGIGSIKRA